jgi:hypothetical protein
LYFESANAAIELNSELELAHRRPRVDRHTNEVVGLCGIDHRRRETDAPHFGKLLYGPIGQLDPENGLRLLLAGHDDLLLSHRQQARRKLGDRALGLERRQHEPRDGPEHEEQPEQEVEIREPVGPVEAATAARAREERRHRFLSAFSVLATRS